MGQSQRNAKGFTVTLVLGELGVLAQLVANAAGRRLDVGQVAPLLVEHRVGLLIAQPARRRTGTFAPGSGRENAMPATAEARRLGRARKADRSRRASRDSAGMADAATVDGPCKSITPTHSRARSSRWYSSPAAPTPPFAPNRIPSFHWRTIGRFRSGDRSRLRSISIRPRSHPRFAAWWSRRYPCF